MASAFVTVGHSTRTAGEFLAILQSAGIEIVVDVRAFPHSRANPQFNGQRLAQSLAEIRIAYQHIAALGGRRSRQQLLPQSPNSYWENASFRNFADYALSESFRSGLRQLRDLGGAARTAIMCSEAVWWRCHRRIIADYLLAAGDEVVHLLGPGQCQPAELTAAAEIIEGGRLLYRSGA
jgi:uncharacterized protein (DUF488 family)